MSKKLLVLIIIVAVVVIALITNFIIGASMAKQLENELDDFVEKVEDDNDDIAIDYGKISVNPLGKTVKIKEFELVNEYEEIWLKVEDLSLKTSVKDLVALAKDGKFNKLEKIELKVKKLGLKTEDEVSLKLEDFVFNFDGYFSKGPFELKWNDDPMELKELAEKQSISISYSKMEFDNEDTGHIENEDFETRISYKPGKDDFALEDISVDLSVSMKNGLYKFSDDMMYEMRYSPFSSFETLEVKKAEIEGELSKDVLNIKKYYIEIEDVFTLDVSGKVDLNSQSNKEPEILKSSIVFKDLSDEAEELIPLLEMGFGEDINFKNGKLKLSLKGSIYNPEID